MGRDIWGLKDGVVHREYEVRGKCRGKVQVGYTLYRIVRRAVGTDYEERGSVELSGHSTSDAAVAAAVRNAELSGCTELHIE